MLSFGSKCVIFNIKITRGSRILLFGHNSVIAFSGIIISIVDPVGTM